MKLTDKQREIALYVFFGALTTAVSTVTYFLFRWVLIEVFAQAGTQIPVLLSWLCAVTFAYITNKLWVFKRRREGLKRAAMEFISFYAARLLTLGVDLLLMFLLVDTARRFGFWYELFIRAVVSVVVLTLNYILSKLIVFRK